MHLGRLDPKIGNAIVAAATEVMEGKLDAHFPLSVWQTGSGTQSKHEYERGDLNRAIEMLGGEMGSKKPVHPNDHVNMSQSSNDTYPTAMYVACAEEIVHALIPALQELRNALNDKAQAWKDIIKIGRTHTQDATPLTLGQEFSGYTQQIENGIARIEQTLPMLMQLAQGGTAVGTGLNAPVGFDRMVAERIASITQLAFTTAPNKFEALAAHDAMGDDPWRDQHGRGLAVQDRERHPASRLRPARRVGRTVAAGERAGLVHHAGQGEPDPVRGRHPSLHAYLRQSRHHHLRGIAGGGHFELNVYNPVMAYSFLQSVRLMADCARSFTEHCIVGIEPRRDNIKAGLERSLMLVTALAPKIGYDAAAKIAKTAHRNGTTLKEEALKTGPCHGGRVRCDRAPRRHDPSEVVHMRRMRSEPDPSHTGLCHRAQQRDSKRHVLAEAAQSERRGQERDQPRRLRPRDVRLPAADEGKERTDDRRAAAERSRPCCIAWAFASRSSISMRALSGSRGIISICPRKSNAMSPTARRS